MKSNHPLARNLFSRLTSLITTEDSRKIENFCTEALAWCLLVSSDFQKAFCEKIGLCDSHLRQHHFDTQHFCKLQNGGHCYIDLLIKPKEFSQKRATIYVVEIKTGSGFSSRKTNMEGEKEKSVHQLLAYLEAASIEFPNVNLIPVSLTIDEKPEQAAVHLLWADVENLLRELAPKDHGKPFLDFADFLQKKNMGTIKIDKLNSNAVSHWHNSNRLQSQFQRVFSDLAEKEEMKSFFRYKKGPKADYDDPRSWFGVYLKLFYVGIAFYPSSEKKTIEAFHYLEYYGNNIKQITEQLDKTLRVDFDFAREIHSPFPANESLVLMRRLNEDDSPQLIIEWFQIRIAKLAKLLKGL